MYMYVYVKIRFQLRDVQLKNNRLCKVLWELLDKNMYK